MTTINNNPMPKAYYIGNSTTPIQEPKKSTLAKRILNIFSKRGRYDPAKIDGLADILTNNKNTPSTKLSNKNLRPTPNNLNVVNDDPISTRYTGNPTSPIQEPKKSTINKKILNAFSIKRDSYDLAEVSRLADTLTNTEDTTSSKLSDKNLWLTLDNLEVINNRLFSKEEVDFNTKASAAKEGIDKILKNCGHMTSDVDAKPSLSVRDTAALSLHFETLSKEIQNNKTQKDICKLIALNLKCDWQQQKLEILHPKLVEQIRPLFQPGASDQSVRSASLAASGGIHVPSAASASAQAGVGLASISSKSPDDEALFFDSTKTKKSVSTSVGAKFGLSKNAGAHANITGNVSIERNDFDLFGSPNDYVTANGYTMAHASRKDDMALVSKLGKKSELKSYKSTLQEAVNSRETFNKLLEQAQCGVQIKQPEPVRKDKTLYGYSTTTSGAAEASAAIGFDTGDVPIHAQVGAALGVRKQYMELNAHLPQQFYTLVSEGNPNFTLPESLTKYARNFIEDQLAQNNASAPEDKVKAAIEGLKDIKGKVEEYYSTVQKYDAKINNKDRAQNKIQKHNLEDKLNAIGRYQYLQFAAASHAHFCHVIKENTSENNVGQESQEPLIKDVANLIYNPTIDISKQKFEALTTFVKDIYLSVNDNVATLKLSVPAFTGQVDIVQRHRVHPSRVRQGDYIDVCLTGKFNVGLQNLDTTELSNQISNFAQHLNLGLGPISITPNAAMGGEVSIRWRYYKPEYSQSNKADSLENFPGEKGWRHRFTRTTGTINTNLGATIPVPVAPGANLIGKVGYSESQTRILNEKIGTQDLTYTINRFTRMYKDERKVDNEEWKNFFDTHKEEYKEIFINLADDNLPITKEVEFFINTELKNQGNGANSIDIDTFKSAMKAYRSTPNDTNFATAKNQLEAYLEAQVPSWEKHHKSRWVEAKYDKNEDSSLKKATKLLRSLKAHPRDRSNKITNNQAPNL